MITKTKSCRINAPFLLLMIFTLCCLVLCRHTFAQQGVSINTSGTTADPSAMLDVKSTSKGLLIPRVALTSINDVSTIANPAVSLLVYNTNPAMTGGNVGFWYFNGSIWIQAIGQQGVQGPVGATGAQGPQGIQGQLGATGAKGVTGATGAQGPQGIQGQLGATGAKGATGATGAQGPQGVQGQVGATGLQGAQGIQGPAGATGAKGATGATGPVGCTTANRLIKSNGTSATCSLIYDNGTNIGIGTTAPTSLLHVSGTSTAIYAENSSSTGKAIYARATSTTGINWGIRSETSSIDGYGIVGYHSSTSSPTTWPKAAGVYGETAAPGSIGVWGVANNGTTVQSYALWGQTNVGGTNSIGVVAVGNGLSATPPAEGSGGYFKGNKYSVYAESPGGSATYAVYANNTGTDGNGIIGRAVTGTNAFGVWGYCPTANGVAGYFSGDLQYTGILTDVSDRKFKKNIEPLDNILPKILMLQPKTYEMKTEEFEFMNLGSGKQFGLIAQDLIKVFPELVKEGVHPDASGDKNIQYLSVNYIDLIPILIQGMKEQQEQIETLETQLKIIKKNNEDLKKDTKKMDRKKKSKDSNVPHN